MGTSLKDICMVSGIVIEDSHNEFSNDWFFVVRIEIACFECGNHESSVFGAHVVAISKLQKPSHLFEVVCRKCATFLTSTWRSQLVEESEIECLARILPGRQLNCTTCHRDKFRGTLDSLGSLAHTNPVPIVSSDLVTNTTQVVPVLNLSTYFTQKVTLSVPPWQREYTWDATSEDGEVAVLLEDLKQFVEDEQKSEYLLGAVILCKTDDPKVVYLIDGQQRTVTLTLLIMCCYQHLKENEALSAEHFRFQTKIHNMITSSEYGYKPHVNFTQENANKIQGKVVANQDISSAVNILQTQLANRAVCSYSLAGKKAVVKVPGAAIPPESVVPLLFDAIINPLFNGTTVTNEFILKSPHRPHIEPGLLPGNKVRLESMRLISHTDGKDYLEALFNVNPTGANNAKAYGGQELIRRFPILSVRIR